MKIQYIFALSLLYGCASHVNYPVGMHTSSESAGSSAIMTSLGAVSQVKIVENFAATNIDPTSGYINPSYAFGLGLIRPVFDSLDLQMSWNYNGPIMAGVKWQLIGNNRAQAGQNNFSAAINYNMGISLASEKTKTSTGETRKFLISTIYQEVDFMIGFRPFAPILIAIGYLYGEFDMGGEALEGSTYKPVYLGFHRGPHALIEYKALPLFFKFDFTKLEVIGKTSNKKYQRYMASFSTGLLF